MVDRKDSVTLAKAGVHLRPLKAWIPAFAGMTIESEVMGKRNFEIVYNTLKNLYRIVILAIKCRIFVIPACPESPLVFRRIPDASATYKADLRE